MGDFILLVMILFSFWYSLIHFFRELKEKKNSNTI